MISNITYKITPFQYLIASHEIDHALGLYHPHQMPDRNQYVNVFTSNIKEGFEANFEIADAEDIETKGLPYDYGSALHYSPLVS